MTKIMETKVIDLELVDGASEGRANGILAEGEDAVVTALLRLMNSRGVRWAK